jgi:hypothetical protein
MGASGAARKTGSRLCRSHFSWPMLRGVDEFLMGASELPR